MYIYLEYILLKYHGYWMHYPCVHIIPLFSLYLVLHLEFHIH